jgi:hypothetical protein
MGKWVRNSKIKKNKKEKKSKKFAKCGFEGRTVIKSDNKLWIW